MTDWTDNSTPLMPCSYCGELLLVSIGRWEALGAAHYGCAGYPFCSCPTPHKGDCTEKTMRRKETK